MLTLNEESGKLLIYAPRVPLGWSRLKIVRNAAKKVAEKLRMRVELVSSEDLPQIQVYYRSTWGELIPLYRDRNEDQRERDVYFAIRNMMFVLSFHPKFSVLKPIRKEIAKLS